MQRAVEKAKQKLDFAKESHDKHEKLLENNSNQIEATKAKLAQAEEDLEGYDKFVRRMQISDKNFEKVHEAIRNDEDGILRLTYQMNALEGKQRDQMGEARENINQRLRALGVPSYSSILNQDSAILSFSYFSRLSPLTLPEPGNFMIGISISSEERSIRRSWMWVFVSDVGFI